MKSFISAIIRKFDIHFTNLLELRFKFNNESDLKLVLPAQIVEINCWSQFIESFNKLRGAYGTRERDNFRRFFWNLEET
mgnify:CR=1 FL=1